MGLVSLIPAGLNAEGLRWLAIGNSITQHGPNEALKWAGESRGMAASSLENDYIHRLSHKMAEGGVTVDSRKIVGRLGRLSAGTIEQVSTVLDELREWKADLVTIQLGENDKLAELGEAGFEERYRTVAIGAVDPTRTVTVICTGVWSPGTPLDAVDPVRYRPGSEAAVKDAIIEKICRERGYVFVPLAVLSANRANYGDGETPGVKWHPNDKGMEGYAALIYAALEKQLKTGANHKGAQ